MFVAQKEMRFVKTDLTAYMIWNMMNIFVMLGSGVILAKQVSKLTDFNDLATNLGLKYTSKGLIEAEDMENIAKNIIKPRNRIKTILIVLTAIFCALLNNQFHEDTLTNLDICIGNFRYFSIPFEVIWVFFQCFTLYPFSLKIMEDSTTVFIRFTTDSLKRWRDNFNSQFGDKSKPNFLIKRFITKRPFLELEYGKDLILMSKELCNFVAMPISGLYATCLLVGTTNGYSFVSTWIRITTLTQVQWYLLLTYLFAVSRETK